LEPHCFLSFFAQQGLLQSNLQVFLGCSEQDGLAEPILHVLALALQHPVPLLLAFNWQVFGSDR